VVGELYDAAAVVIELSPQLARDSVVVIVVEVAEVVEIVVVVAVDVVVVNVNTVLMLIAIGRLPCDDHHYLKSRVEVSHPVLQHVLPPVP